MTDIAESDNILQQIPKILHGGFYQQSIATPWKDTTYPGIHVESRGNRLKRYTRALGLVPCDQNRAISVIVFF